MIGLQKRSNSLTQVNDLLAGWSWEAYPTADGYKFIVKDPNGDEWGRDFYYNLDMRERQDYTNLSQAWLYYQQKDPKKYPSFDAYAKGCRMGISKHNPRKVKQRGEWWVRQFIKDHLKYNVHPQERPTLGVSYVGS